MKKNILLIFLTIILFSSCASSNSSISLGANLHNYNYAYVLADIQRTAFVLDMEKKIFEGLQNTRLEMIYFDQIDDLNDSQKDSLLRVTFSYTGGSTTTGTVVGGVYVGATSSSEGYGTLNILFQDYRNNNIVASCSGVGLSVNEDVRLAIRESIKLFPK
jgi:hypothetical protein